MKINRSLQGHLSAFLTIFIWGTTYISTKVLLESFSPIEILFFRIVLAYLALWLIAPRRLPFTELKEELLFMLAGLFGVTLFFTFQNTAINYTLASNVGVLIAIAPLFTAIGAYLFLKEGSLHPGFFIGFGLSFLGVFLILFNGNYVLKLNPFGDLLAILSAFVWAGYSIVTRKISERQVDTILVTRKVFFYGLIFLLPLLVLFDFQLDLTRFSSATNLFNMLFLGLGASALCFVTWNFAVKVLGAVKTSAYIYLGPVISILTSAIVIQERITLLAILGVGLILAGLILSERSAQAQSIVKT
jgi:drug/metabolite transporter (DMT)-like permease